MAEPRQRGELSPEEQELMQGEDLPDREAPSLVDANAAFPINAAIATADTLSGELIEANADREKNVRPIRRSDG
jgi:hypothetical protein